MTESFLSHFENVSGSDGQYLVRCPVAAHKDNKASLSVKFTPEGRILLHCHAGCPTPEIVKAIGLEMSDLSSLFLNPKNGALLHNQNQPTETIEERANATEISAGYLLMHYCIAKKLPEPFLKELGLSDHFHKGLARKVLRVPYLDLKGVEQATRYRIAAGGDNKFLWRKGNKPFLYGLWRLKNGVSSIFVCEGESDCHTLWYHGYNALGLPGADSWNENRDAPHFKAIERIYIVDEGDSGSDAVKHWLSKSSIRTRAHLIKFSPFKDPSALHIDDPASFKTRLEEIVKNCIPWTEIEKARVTEICRDSLVQCKSLASEKNILEVFADQLPKIGLAGELPAAKLSYLALTSRIQNKPMNVALDGPSAGGKSFVLSCVLKFFPPDIYHDFTSMSEKNLAYTEIDLKHKFIIFYEWGGVTGDFMNYLLRSLLSEGVIKYEFVNKTSEGLKSQRIEKEGPTGLLFTTTAVDLHPENQTRLITVTVNDSKEQTQQILEKLAEDSQEKIDFTPWHALQTLIQHQNFKVSIPYAMDLARLTNPVAVRLRRDFSVLLSLIKSHAILHHQTRERKNNTIIAILDDYAAVLGLIEPLISYSVEASIPKTIKETVSAVEELIKNGEEVTSRAIEGKLKLDQSTTNRRIRAAIKKGYLNDLHAGKEGVIHKYELGEPLHEKVLIFPTPSRLEEAMQAYISKIAPELPDNIDESGTISSNSEKVCSYAPFSGFKNSVHIDHHQIFVDTETTGLDPYANDLVLIQIKAGDEVFLINLKDSDLEPVKHALEDPKILKVFHNAIFDLKFLKKHLGCSVNNIFDTMIAERLLTAGISTLRDCSLESLAKKYLNVTLNKSCQKSFDGLELTQAQIDYARADVDILQSIFEAQKKQLKNKGLIETAQLEFSIIPAMADMELKGILVDTEKLSEIQKKLEASLLELEKELKDYASINVSSPKQVLETLNGMGFKVEDTKDSTLEGIDHPFVKLILKHRRASKLHSSFATKLPTRVNPHTGRIHPDFLQVGTDTGRISCQKPNLQQIPKEQEWRDLFMAPEGYKMITADYSQIELRILAEFSRDPKFLEAYKMREDLHQKVADSLGISRDAAKTVNFGIIYGMGPSGLSKQLGIKTAEAEKIINAYFGTYSKVKRTLEELEAKPLVNGFAVTPLGRKRFFGNVSDMKEHSAMKRKGRNTPIQSTCGDILKKAIHLLYESLGAMEAGIINVIHDEILIECRNEDIEEAAGIIRNCMVQAGEEFIKAVPVEVNITVDQRWKK